VVRVREDACEVWSREGVRSIAFAPTFPSPRAERVSPGHLVAFAGQRDGRDFVVWRWYDAVVLGDESDGTVRLWEPGHGEVIARPRESYRALAPGSRAYASAGLPGAAWWVAGAASGDPTAAEVDLQDVEDFYTDNDLWSAALADTSPAGQPDWVMRR
jgi:hypothetical protein